jgi:protoporphyrinogen oxidase
MFVRPRRTITTLIEEFDYPRLGPGMMWRTLAARIAAEGGEVRLRSPVVAVNRAGHTVTGVMVASNGTQTTVAADVVVSTMPVTELVRRIDPPAPAAVVAAAGQLRYRDFLMVCLIVRRSHIFPDNWIYVHDPEVRVGRVQNFKNWSPDMVPDPSRTSLGLEYFCNEGDALWRSSDQELVALGARELARIGLVREDEVEDGCVARVRNAYPIYDTGYAGHLDTVRRFVDHLEHLRTAGRNGLHRYNNQDHAMLTGMLAARSLVAGEEHDVWSVNTDQEYLEEVRAEATVGAREVGSRRAS